MIPFKKAAAVILAVSLSAVSVYADDGAPLEGYTGDVVDFTDGETKGSGTESMTENNSSGKGSGTYNSGKGRSGGPSQRVPDSTTQASTSKRGIKQIFESARSRIKNSDDFDKPPVIDSTGSRSSQTGSTFLTPSEMSDFLSYYQSLLESFGSDYVSDLGYTDFLQNLSDYTGDPVSYYDDSEEYGAKNAERYDKVDTRESGDDWNSFIGSGDAGFDGGGLDFYDLFFGGYPLDGFYPGFDGITVGDLQDSVRDMLASMGMTPEDLENQDFNFQYIPINSSGDGGYMIDPSGNIYTVHGKGVYGLPTKINDNLADYSDSIIESLKPLVEQWLSGNVNGGDYSNTEDGIQVFYSETYARDSISQMTATNIEYSDKRKWTVYKRNDDGSKGEIIFGPTQTNNAEHNFLYQFIDEGKYIVQADRWGSYDQYRSVSWKKKSVMYVPALGQKVIEEYDSVGPYRIYCGHTEGWLSQGDSWKYNIYPLDPGNAESNDTYTTQREK